MHKLILADFIPAYPVNVHICSPVSHCFQFPVFEPIYNNKTCMPSKAAKIH